MKLPLERTHGEHPIVSVVLTSAVTELETEHTALLARYALLLKRCEAGEARRIRVTVEGDAEWRIATREHEEATRD
jgi:hypothetical protein